MPPRMTVEVIPFDQEALCIERVTALIRMRSQVAVALHPQSPRATPDGWVVSYPDLSTNNPERSTA